MSKGPAVPADLKGIRRNSLRRGGGEDGGGGGDDGDIAAARGAKSWLLLEGVALGKVVPVCETESVGQARAPTTGDSAGGLYYW